LVGSVKVGGGEKEMEEHSITALTEAYIWGGGGHDRVKPMNGENGTVH